MNTKLKYQIPKTFGDPVAVRSGDNTIGKVFLNYENDIPEYSAYDREGNPLLSSTTEWSDVETAFEHYNREFLEQNRISENEAWAIKMADREREIKEIRKERTHSINLKPLSI
jgi:hypothetical protein